MAKEIKITEGLNTSKDAMPYQDGVYATSEAPTDTLGTQQTKVGSDGKNLLDNSSFRI